MQITAEPGSPQMTATRDVAAPRDLVYRAYTEPELLAQWMGPRRLTMIVDVNELHHGGRWRFVHHDAEGNTFGFRGVFHGDPSPEGIVRTFEFEGAPGYVSLEMLTLEPIEGGTRIHMNVVHDTVISRDMHLQNGMEAGMRESMERLDDLLVTLVPSAGRA
jgi:uncharacterized protein YndB with AHSA1/START domain